jgi:hypothetical protein
LSVHKQKTIEAFEDNVERLLDRQGYRATPEGRAMINKYVEPLTEFIADKRIESRRRANRNGSSGKPGAPCKCGH